MKNIKKITFAVLCLLVFSYKIEAASLSVRTPSASMTKGGSAVITTTISSSSPIVSIEGSLSCSGAGVSGGIDLRYDDGTNSLYTKTYSFTVKPTEAGTISCTTSNVRITDMSSATWQSLTDDYVKITVSNPPTITPKVYSSNNYLSSLSVEGYTITPEFDKEVLEYSLEVENGVSSVKVNAQAENSNATIKGTGDISVSEGNNNIEIIVTAENGNTRTYKLNVVVKELNPINTKVDDEDYTIVRKKPEDLYTLSTTYEETTIKINDEEVLAYYSDTTKYLLVILKDSKGNIDYYIYDNNKYTLYKEYTIGGITLYPTNKEYQDTNYKKASFTYEDNKIDAYKLTNNSGIIKSTYALDTSASNYYLFYAINVYSGKEELYQVDTTENTVQKYNSGEVNLYKAETKTYKNYFYLLAIILIVVIISLIIALIVKYTRKNKYSRR